tara:strand:+ start:265 stop:540 length:276 start_codon:yes stop_codon:yes gene_type:complete
MEQIDALRDIVSLLESKGHNKKKKRRLAVRMRKELDNLISKYEYMYDKYVLKNKPLNRLYTEKEKEIKIVQNSIRTFFPYILAYNVAQMSE